MVGLFNKLGLYNNKKEVLTYDKDHEYPVLHSSICTGEKVAGFKDKDTGKFRDVMLIRNEKELEQFKEMYGIKELKTDY